MTLRNMLLAVTGVTIVALPAIAVPAETTLKAIMQGLRQNLIDITDGILLDDFGRVAEGALAIAEHPKIPPQQVGRIADELGAEMPVFKNFDVQVHELSLELFTAATERDRDTVVSAYQRMVAACFGCHAAYRERVTAALDSAD